MDENFEKTMYEKRIYSRLVTRIKSIERNKEITDPEGIKNIESAVEKLKEF